MCSIYKPFTLLALCLFVLPTQLLSQVTSAIGSGSLLSFDGNDEIEIAHNNNLNLGANFTLECWVKLNSTSNQPFIHKWDPNQYTLEIFNGKMGFVMGYNNTGTRHIQGNLTPVTNKWYHVAGTYDGSTMKLYVNGELDASFTVTGTPNSGTAGDFLTIGCRSDAGSQFLNGDLDEVRIWNTDLTQNQIRDWMCRKITSNHPEYANLVSYYNFDENTGTTLNDLKNSNDGTLQANPNIPTWDTSTVPLGDSVVWIADPSATSSSSLSLETINGDKLSAEMTSGSAELMLIYQVNGRPINDNLPNLVNELSSTNYFGTFIVEDNSSELEIELDYDGQTGITNEYDLRILGRNNPISTWAKLGGTLDTADNTLIKSNESFGEYILGTVGEDELSNITLDSLVQLTLSGSTINGPTGGSYGYDVALNHHGTIVAIGNVSNSSGSNGGFSVYQLSSQTWSKMGTSIVGTGRSIPNMGRSISLNKDGGIVAVGAPGDSRRQGYVKVYEWDASANAGSGAWIQKGSDITGSSFSDEFGYDVSLDASGDKIAISGPGHDGDKGHVRVYEWDASASSGAGAWVQIGTDLDGEAGSDLSGTALSLSPDGNRVAIGAPVNSANGSASGHFRVYEWDATANGGNGNWVQKGTDKDGGGTQDHFGRSISLSYSGDTIIAVAYSYSSVYVWDNTLNSGIGDWKQLGSTIDIGGLGQRVSISNNGNQIAISDWGADEVRIYEWNASANGGTGDWNLKTRRTRADDAHSFSINLSRDGSTIAEGGLYSSGGFRNLAEVYKIPIYVDLDATGSNNGKSWQNAFTDLQDAIDQASNTFQPIWVAEGTYSPTKDETGTAGVNDRDNTFYIYKDGIELYGGFDGTETELSQRNVKMNITILSGDMDNDGNTSDNATNVVFIDGSTNNITGATVIDGFTISDGKSNATTGTDRHSVGAGIACFATVAASECSPTIRNCILKNNQAHWGGAIIFYSRPTTSGGKLEATVENCIFYNNIADASGGAIEFSFTDHATSIINCTFHNNSAGSSGVGACNNTSSTVNNTITNCIFWDNKKGTNASIAGSDLSSGFNVTYSLTQAMSNYSTGTGIINNDNPFFLDAANGLFMLQAGSPALDAATSTGAPTIDIYGNTRSGSYDLGAFEIRVCGDSVALPTVVGTTYTGYYAHTDGNGWKHFCTDDNKLLLSLKLDGSGAIVDSDEVQLKLGVGTTYSYLGSDGGMVNTNDKGYVMIDRRWDVQPTAQPSSGNVGVKYFFTQDEYEDLETELLNHGTNGVWKSTLDTALDVSIYKSTSGSAFADPHTVSGIVLANGATPSTTVWKHSTHGSSDHIAEFEVSSFSGGGGGGGGGGGANPAPLPVELIHFNATPAVNHSAYLTWATALELNNSHFEILRSYDGKSFEVVDIAAGNGTTSDISEYAYNDRSIDNNAQVVYYRLRQVDYDGASELTEIRVVNFANQASFENGITVYPNPAREMLYISLADMDGELISGEILDINGRMVLEFELTSNITAVDMSSLLAGVYYVRLNSESQVKHVKITKQ